MVGYCPINSRTNSDYCTASSGLASLIGYRLNWTSVNSMYAKYRWAVSSGFWLRWASQWLQTPKHISISIRIRKTPAVLNYWDLPFLFDSNRNVANLVLGLTSTSYRDQGWFFNNNTELADSTARLSHNNLLHDPNQQNVKILRPCYRFLCVHYLRSTLLHFSLSSVADLVLSLSWTYVLAAQMTLEYQCALHFSCDAGWRPLKYFGIIWTSFVLDLQALRMSCFWYLGYWKAIFWIFLLSMIGCFLLSYKNVQC